RCRCSATPSGRYLLPSPASCLQPLEVSTRVEARAFRPAKCSPSKVGFSPGLGAAKLVVIPNQAAFLADWVRDLLFWEREAPGSSSFQLQVPSLQNMLGAIQAIHLAQTGGKCGVRELVHPEPRRAPAVCRLGLPGGMLLAVIWEQPSAPLHGVVLLAFSSFQPLTSSFQNASDCAARFFPF